MKFSQLPRLDRDRFVQSPHGIGIMRSRLDVKYDNYTVINTILLTLEDDAITSDTWVVAGGQVQDSLLVLS